MPACETQTPAPIQHDYHRLRKAIHLLCFLTFLALPFANVMRFDIPRQRFYCFTFELWINEFGIIFLSLMFLMFVVVASSIVYGRVYCGYACPQMIFSEASQALEDWLKRKIDKRFSRLSPTRRKRLWRISFYGVVSVASVFLAFVFISYFVEPSDLLNRLFSLDVHTAGGVSGVVVTLITFLDFTLLRQRFCTSVCPYGYLQGLLGDRNTLLVHYRDPGRKCINCKKCVRVCQMGIDIRDGPFQIQCVHCGECIDACDQIMGRLKQPGLIHYAWGEAGHVVESESAWYLKLGIRDAKRVLVLLITVLYLAGLSVALSMRRAVLVQLSPDRSASLYTIDTEGRVRNTFRVKIANRSKSAALVTLEASGLPGASIVIGRNPIAVERGATAEAYFDVAAAPFNGAEEVNHFRIVARSSPVREQEAFEETFLMPERKTK